MLIRLCYRCKTKEQKTARERPLKKREFIMIKITDYLTDEQAAIIATLQDDGYELALDWNEADINKATTEQELEKARNDMEKNGVGRFERYQKSLARDIESLQENIRKLQKDLEEKTSAVELMERLGDIGLNDIVDQLIEDRQKEINEAEWFEYWYISKEKPNWRHNDTIIIVEKYRREKGNEYATKQISDATFIVYWNERKELAALLKARGAKIVTGDKELLTQKLRNEFNIL